MLTLWMWMANDSGVIEGGLFNPLFTWIDILFVTPAVIMFILGSPIGDVFFKFVERKLRTRKEKEG